MNGYRPTRLEKKEGDAKRHDLHGRRERDSAIRGSGQLRDLTTGVPSPDEAVQYIMCDLRHGQHRNQDRFDRFQIPRPAEEPRTLVPDAAIPKKFFHIGQDPDQADETRQAARLPMAADAGRSIRVAAWWYQYTSTM